MGGEVAVPGYVTNGGYVLPVDISNAPVITAKMSEVQLKAANNGIPTPPTNNGRITNAGIDGTPQFKFFKKNLENAANLTLPVEAAKKIANNEPLTAFDYIDLASIIPAAKVAKLIKLGDLAVGVVKFAGFGGDIVINSNRTTTVLGRFDGTIDKLKESGLFQKEGLRFLNVPTEIVKKGDDFFTKFNVPFLEKAIKKGEIVRFVSDPTDAKNLFINGINKSDGLTTFGKEVEFLKSKGFEIKKGTTEIDLSKKP